MSTSPSGRAAMTQAEFTYLERVAALAADSGLYGSGAKTKAQLLMKLIYGRDLGISLSAALSGIDIYDGKMELSANLIAALLEAHPHYAYAILESTNERCELEFFKDERSLGTAKFDQADATTAGLADTEYYRQYPSDMFFARAMTRGARRHCPGLGPRRTHLLKRRAGQAHPGAHAGAVQRERQRRRARDGRGRGDDLHARDARRHRRRRAVQPARRPPAAGHPVSDRERAARGLARALERLPLALVPTVCETLRERVAAAEAEQAASPDAPPAPAGASEREA